MQVLQRRRLVRIICALGFAAGAVQASAQAKLSKQDATRFAAKLVQIEKNSLTPRTAGAARSTQVSDAEVNAYLKFLAGSQVPVGIVEPVLSGVGTGASTGAPSSISVRSAPRRSAHGPTRSGISPGGSRSPPRGH